LPRQYIGAIALSSFEKVKGVERKGRGVRRGEGISLMSYSMLGYIMFRKRSPNHASRLLLKMQNKLPLDPKKETPGHMLKKNAKIRAKKR